jgi:hypothetical protein
MAINLQYAIDFASGRPSVATVVVSMHDAAGVVLFGFANPTFREDVPLVYGTASIGGSTIGRRSGVPGFSTRGDPPPPPPASNEFLRSDETTGTGVPPQRFAASKPVPMEFSVRRNPGFSRYLPPPFGPSVQIEIATLPAVGGTVVHAVSLDADEDGDLLRAVGYSVQNPTQNASYTVTLIDLSPTGP